MSTTATPAPFAVGDIVAAIKHSIEHGGGMHDGAYVQERHDGTFTVDGHLVPEVLAADILAALRPASETAKTELDGEAARLTDAEIEEYERGLLATPADGKPHVQAMIKALAEIRDNRALSRKSIPSQEAGVRELEWRESPGLTNWAADCLLGTWHIVYTAGKYWLRLKGGAFDGGHQFLTLVSAKAAAQADFAQRIRSCLTSTPAEEAGWQLVPKEPTEAMVATGWGVHPGKEGIGSTQVSDCYRAMLAAAPLPTDTALNPDGGA